jgi:RimJ/RimL family protein N-acetyltransferase
MAWTPIQREPSPEVMRLLRLAEEGDERICATIADPAHETYLHQVGDDVIGVVTMHWHAADSEIIYLAVAPEQQGKGYGKAIISAVIGEAQRRQITRLVVGTGNSSLANIAFYQKCGFRMDHVRRDFYDYIQPPIREDGIPLRDMLVFSLDVEEFLSSTRSG